MQESIVLELRRDRVREDVAAYLHPLVEEALEELVPFCDLVNWVADGLIERHGTDEAEVHAAERTQRHSAA